MHLLGTATIVEVHSFHADPPLTSYTVMVKVSPLAFFLHGLFRIVSDLVIMRSHNARSRSSYQSISMVVFVYRRIFFYLNH